VSAFGDPQETLLWVIVRFEVGEAAVVKRFACVALERDPPRADIGGSGEARSPALKDQLGRHPPAVRVRESLIVNRGRRPHDGCDGLAAAHRCDVDTRAVGDC
jgi:hypothetical protein